MRSFEPDPLRSIRERLFAPIAMLALLLSNFPARGQDPTPRPRLLGPYPGGARSYLSDQPGTLDFGIVNSGLEELHARVVSFYAEEPERQYGREVWVPARSTLRSWFRVEAPRNKPVVGSVEVKSYVYDKTGQTEHLVKSPQGQPFHSSLLPYERKDGITSLMLDADVEDGSGAADSTREQGRSDLLREMVRVFRHSCGLSSRINAVKQQFLPPIPEALDGIDQFVLASDRLEQDKNGQRALRQWVEQGGHLLIPVDHVSQSTISSLLGDILDFQIVDRVSVTEVLLNTGCPQAYVMEKQARQLERPVDFVRVLAPGQQIYYTLDGWPVASCAKVGKGKVIFTMLGASAWMLPRTKADPPSNFHEFPALPVPTIAFQFVSDELLVRRSEREVLADDALRSFVVDQISYQVINRRLVLFVFGSLFLGLTAIAVVLSRKTLLEHLGWIGPCFALMATLVFVVMGTKSREAVPPTVAVLQLVNAVPGVNAVPAAGSIGVYQSELSESTPGATQGGEFNLDLAGFERRIVTRLQDDIDRWHFEKLEFPSGVRTGTFQYTVPTEQPIDAWVRFGKQGIEGRVASGPFQNLEDAVLVTPGRHVLPVTLGNDGTIQVGEELGPQSGQFISSGLLSDRQRLHQTIYQEILSRPLPRHEAEYNTLMVWADPLDMHFVLGEKPRLVGASLLSIPVRLENPAPGSEITVPAAFVDCRKVGVEGQLLPPETSFRFPMKLQLRFQLPANVLPFAVEGGRLAIKMRARARTVDVSVQAGDKEKSLKRLAGPFGLEEIEIGDSASLPFDELGRLTLNLDVGSLEGSVARDQWNLDWVGLEVRGRARTQQGSPRAPEPK
jgi:hypothetical protein